MTRRFQINPDPLRTTGQRVKEDHDTGRCQATTHDGLRCLRDALDGERYCWQHQAA